MRGWEHPLESCQTEEDGLSRGLGETLAVIKLKLDCVELGEQECVDALTWAVLNDTSDVIETEPSLRQRIVGDKRLRVLCEGRHDSASRPSECTNGNEYGDSSEQSQGGHPERTVQHRIYFLSFGFSR